MRDSVELGPDEGVVAAQELPSVATDDEETRARQAGGSGQR